MREKLRILYIDIFYFLFPKRKLRMRIINFPHKVKTFFGKFICEYKKEHNYSGFSRNILNETGYFFIVICSRCDHIKRMDLNEKGEQITELTNKI